ncbi:MAG: murein biosynthesis integral membrane protein MurJ [Anaerolineaceae bacterium]|nr:murein biosynthesis integral membrane protein MurJ [Anaerolineaceae bacterium]
MAQPAPVSALSNRQILRAALVVLLGFVASGVLGVLRTAIVAARFGTGDALDAFFRAQQLPEMIFVLVAGGALGSSFIPVYARVRAQDEASAWRLASAAMTLSALAAGALGALVFLLAPLITRHMLAPQVTPELQALTSDLMRAMMLTPLVFSISGLLMGLLHAHQRFLLPSLAISMNSIGLIIGALLIAPALPPDPGAAQVGDANVYGLAWGAVLSALLHLLVQLPGLRGLGAQLRPLADWSSPALRDVLRLMGPRVLGLAVARVNFLVNAAFTSAMVAGSITALFTAFTLLFFALGVVGQSLGSALFPTLSALAAAGDMDGFRARLVSALRGALFLAFPAMLLLILLGEPLVKTLFERGQWSAESSAATAWALAFYASGMAGFVLLELLSRAFYALEDSRTPVLVGVATMLANILLSLLFIRFIGEPGNLARGPFAGLALANALATNVEALVLWWLLRRRLGNLDEAGFLRSAPALLLACAGLGIAVGLWLGQAQSPLTQLLGGGGIGLAVFLGLGMLLRLEEARALPRLLPARLRD